VIITEMLLATIMGKSRKAVHAEECPAENAPGQSLSRARSEADERRYPV
jgi:hypothetical protein